MDHASRRSPILLLMLCLLCLVACGGGGGGGGGGGSGAAASQGGSAPLPEVIEFREPETFANGRTHVTARTSLRFTGGVRSERTPDLDCDQAANFQLRPFAEVRWRNLDTGDAGTTPASSHCWNTGTVFGVGVRSFWATDYVALEVGLNRVEFSTFDAGRQVGRDVVTVRRTDGVPASLLSHSPAGDATGVPVNHEVQVIFSEPMLESSLTSSRLVVADDDGNEVPGAYHYDPIFFAWSFVPTDDLAPNTRYRVRVSRNVIDVGRGGGLANDVEWFFETGNERDDAAPVVVLRWPDEQCDCAPASTTVVATFDGALRASSVARDSMRLTDADGEVVAGRLRLLGNQLEFVPETELRNSEHYLVTVVAGLRDSAGNRMSVHAIWSFGVNDGGVVGTWQEGAASANQMTGAVAVQDGNDVYVWGVVDEPDPDFCETTDDACANRRNLGRGKRYQLASDDWQPLAYELPVYDPVTQAYVPQPFPSVREYPSAIWTGAEMVLFGGDGPTKGGGRYDPVADAWTNLSNGWWEDGRLTYLQGLAGHSAIWTGSRMIIWGGYYDFDDDLLNRGWLYDPQADSWAIMGPTPSLDESFHIIPDPAAPAPRQHHAAVWTGSEMIVWGGEGADGKAISDGGRFKPDSGTWTALPATDAPDGSASGVSAVWTGSTLIAWNGGRGVAGGPQLAMFDPSNATWQRSTSGWEPRFATERGAYVAFWTGSEMIVAGFEPESLAGESGGAPGVLPGEETTRELAVYLYDPALDRWRQGARQVIETQGRFAAQFVAAALIVFDGRRLHRYDVR